MMPKLFFFQGAFFFFVVRLQNWVNVDVFVLATPSIIEETLNMKPRLDDDQTQQQCT